jgi:hypothetical protein
MTSTEKKGWSTPKLRVFVRSRTEERVLENCKTATFPGTYHGSERACRHIGCGTNCSVIVSS